MSIKDGPHHVRVGTRELDVTHELVPVEHFLANMIGGRSRFIRQAEIGTFDDHQESAIGHDIRKIPFTTICDSFSIERE